MPEVNLPWASMPDLNLELPPFNFSAPLCRSIQFRPTGAQMHLWDLQELRSILIRS